MGEPGSSFVSTEARNSKARCVLREKQFLKYLKKAYAGQNNSGLFKRFRKGRRQQSATCVCAAASESGADTTFRNPVTVLAMWAIHRVDGTQVLETNLCGTNWMLTGNGQFREVRRAVQRPARPEPGECINKSGKYESSVGK